MTLGMILRAVAAIWRIPYFTDISINRSRFFVKKPDAHQNSTFSNEYKGAASVCFPS